jgi:tRNA(Ile)-lysidine synthase
VVERVLAYIREHALLRAGDRVAVAVSGGPDSVALLRLLLELRSELGLVLAVAHFHHGIRGAEADADQQFVAELARVHSLPLHTASADAPAHAAVHGLSLETAARELRYAWFRKLLGEGEADRVATGHTLDDQAETVLMRLLRGSGTRGLAGIFPLQRVEAASDRAIVRPLLNVRRREIAEYLRGLAQEWREDQSNRDLRHLRNRIRHRLLPELERDYNPSLARVLAESAELARAEEECWSAEVERLLPRVWQVGALDTRELARHPLALQRRLLRGAGESLGLRLNFEHVQGLLRLAAMTAAPGPVRSCELPGGWQASGSRGQIRFQHLGAGKEAPAGDYEYRLAVPGEIRVAEIGTVIRASLLPLGASPAGYNRAGLWDPGSLAPELVVRNWRAGDRFWPAHTKSPKKVKALLQERRVQPAERAGWPVVVSGESIIWVRGFPPPERFRPGTSALQAVVIEEVTGDTGRGGKSSH